MRHTVRCRYNAVKFLTNVHKRHRITRPLGRDMECLLWIQPLIDILSQILQLFTQYLTILDCVITALDYVLFICLLVCMICMSLSTRPHGCHMIVTAIGFSSRHALR